ncbi:MAG: TonB-dependent receptor [Lysobacterales bacterium]|jgi:outer membrane receptor protein involved in Fe transport
MSHARTPLALSIAFALLVLPAQAVRGDASAAATELDRIVVTAQKREQQVQEVPIAITALSGEFLDRLNISGFADINGYVPGLQTQVQSPNNPGFVIRGITSDSGDSQIEPRVSVFQDGVSISRSRGAVVEFFDLERIEVLRGPQGTLFGRGAQIGAVHLIQNKARKESSAHVRFGLGNLDAMSLEGHANTPISDTLSARVAVFHEQRDGFIENLSGGDLNGRDTSALRLSFGLDLGERSRMDLIFNHQTDSPPGTAFRSNVIPTREGSTELFRSAADLNRGEALGLDRHVNGVTLLGDFALTDSYSLSSITGWRDFDSREEFDADGSQINVLEFAEDAEGRQFSQELRFNYDAGGRFRGFGGLSWFDERGSQRVPFATDERSFYALLSPVLNRATGGQLPVVPLLNPDGTPNTRNVPPGLPGLAPGLPAFIALKPLHREEYANFGAVEALEFFADGTWRFSDALELTLGLRGTREKVDNGYEALYFGQPSALGQLLPSPAAPAFPNVLFRPTQGVIRGSEEYDSMVGRAVLAWRVSDTLNTYASVARGRRPDVLQVNGGGVQEVPAEIVLSYEVGAKGELAEGRFLYDIAVFHYDYSDFQAQVQNPNAPPFFITTNAGNASAQGLELSFSQRISDSFGGFLNIGWIDASFDNTDDAGRPQALAGNRFRLTPEYTAALGLDWRVDLADGASVYVRPSYSWRSQVFFEDANQPGIEQGAYGLFNLSAGWRFNPHLELQVYGQNLADEEYLIDAGNTGALFGIPSFVPGTPRTYGLRVRLDW